MRKPVEQHRRQSALKDVIARRVLTGAPPSRRRHEVRIGRPEQFEGWDWRCAYHIRGIGMRRPQHIYGVDAFQALMLALQAIRVRLDTAGVPVQWLGGEIGDHGFPRHLSSAFGLAVERRIERLMDREILRQSKMLAAKARRRKKRTSS